MTAGDAQPTFPGEATLVFRRRVRPGRETEYRSWVAGIQNASRGVPGFLGASTMRHAPGDEYTSLVRFASAETLRAWEQSELRREWIARLPPDTVAGEAHVDRLEGLEFWFTAPGLSAPAAPSPHKMVVVLSVVVFLLAVALGAAVRTIPVALPPLARTAVLVVLQVVLMTYVIMPRVTRLLARWLFPR